MTGHRNRSSQSLSKKYLKVQLETLLGFIVQNKIKVGEAVTIIYIF